MGKTYNIRNWLFLLLGDSAVLLLSVRLSALLYGYAMPELCAGIGTGVLLTMLYLVSFYVFDLYNTNLRFTGGAYLARFLVAVLIGASLFAAVSYLYPATRLPRGMFVLNTVIIAAAAYCWRLLYHAMVAASRRNRKIVIVGAGEPGKAVYDMIRECRRDDFQVIGFLDDDAQLASRRIGSGSVIGGTGMLADLTREGEIDVAVIAITDNKKAALLESLIKAKVNGIEIYDIPSFCEIITGKLPVSYLRDGWVAFTPFHGMRRGMYTMRFKRLFDVALSLAGLLLALPIGIVTALLTKLDSDGPVLFRQQRVGLSGRNFDLLKFRTMTTGTENDRSHAGEKDDPRITRVGKVLRRFRIDEIPQMWNVLMGDMSFIGPRSLIEEEVAAFESQIPYFSLRHCIRPGITGWAQVNYQHGASVKDGYEKLQYDLFYIKNLSPLLDLHILLKTVRVVLFGKGAK